MDILLTLSAAALAGMLFYKIKIPGGLLVGGIVGTLLFSLTFQKAHMPYAAKFFSQVATGAFISSSVSRSDIRKIIENLPVILIQISSFLILNLLLGGLLFFISDMDLLTAMMCAIPGGLSDVPLTASDMGADVSSVVVLQFIRSCVGIGIFPMWILHVSRGGRPESDKKTVRHETVKKQKTGKTYEAGRVTALLGLAAVCGYIGRLLSVPAGPLVFSLAGVLAYNLLFTPVPLPPVIKRAAMVLSGAYIGCSIGYDALIRIPRLFLPALVICLGHMINAYLTGMVIHKTFSVSVKESMLIMSPAGASDMALISADMGVNSTLLIVAQILRLVAAASVFPQIIYFLCTAVT